MNEQNVKNSLRTLHTLWDIFSIFTSFEQRFFPLTFDPKNRTGKPHRELLTILLDIRWQGNKCYIFEYFIDEKLKMALFYEKINLKNFIQLFNGWKKGM